MVTTPIEELRSAAVLLRQRAEEATPGPWAAHADGLVWPSVLGDPAAGADIVENANYIATMDPLVGLALADWLDAVAERSEKRTAATVAMGVDREIGYAAMELSESHALALARLLLGGAS